MFYLFATDYNYQSLRESPTQLLRSKSPRVILSKAYKYRFAAFKFMNKCVVIMYSSQSPVGMLCIKLLSMKTTRYEFKYLNHPNIYAHDMILKYKLSHTGVKVCTVTHSLSLGMSNDRNRSSVFSRFCLSTSPSR